LGVHADNAKASALREVVVESDPFGKIWAGIKSARSLVAIDRGSGECVFEDPVGTGLRSFKACDYTIAEGEKRSLEVPR